MDAASLTDTMEGAMRVEDDVQRRGATHQRDAGRRSVRNIGFASVSSRCPSRMPSAPPELKVVSVAAEQLSPRDAATVVSEVVKSTLFLRGLLPALYDDIVTLVRRTTKRCRLPLLLMLRERC